MPPRVLASGPKPCGGNKAAFSWRICVDGRPNRRNKAAFSWRISVDGRSNRRNKAAFSLRISVDGRPNRRNKAVFSWRISVDGRPNRRNKATFSWRISLDGRPNRRNKAVFSHFSGVDWTLPEVYDSKVCRIHCFYTRLVLVFKVVSMLEGSKMRESKLCMLENILPSSITSWPTL